MKRYALPLLAVLLLGGCAADENTAAETPTPVPTVTVTVTATPKPTPTRTSSPVAPSPTAQPVESDVMHYEDELFLTALGTIREGLNHERSLNRAENMCTDIAAGMDEAGLLGRVVSRFEGGSAPDISDYEAAAILELVRTTCE
jgi:hypothetical protein